MKANCSQLRTTTQTSSSRFKFAHRVLRRVLHRVCTTDTYDTHAQISDRLFVVDRGKCAQNSEIRKIRGVDTQNEIDGFVTEKLEFLKGYRSQRVLFVKVSWTFAFNFHEISPHSILFCIGFSHRIASFRVSRIARLYVSAIDIVVESVLHSRSLNVQRLRIGWSNFVTVSEIFLSLVVQPQLTINASSISRTRLSMISINSNN